MLVNGRQLRQGRDRGCASAPPKAAYRSALSWQSWMDWTMCWSQARASKVWKTLKGKLSSDTTDWTFAKRAN